MTEPHTHIFPVSYAELNVMEQVAAAIGAEDVRMIAAAIRDSWSAREHGRNKLAASPLDRGGRWYDQEGAKILFEELLPPGTRVTAIEHDGMMPCAASSHIDERRHTLSINDALLCTCPKCGEKHLAIECRGQTDRTGPYRKWRVVLCAQDHGVVIVPLLHSWRYASWEEMRADDSRMRASSCDDHSSLR